MWESQLPKSSLALVIIRVFVLYFFVMLIIYTCMSCGFKLHFPNDCLFWTSFYMLVHHQNICLGTDSDFFYSSIIHFLIVWFLENFLCSRHKSFFRNVICKWFLKLCGWSLYSLNSSFTKQKALIWWSLIYQFFLHVICSWYPV